MWLSRVKYKIILEVGNSRYSALKSALLNIHFFVREENIEIIFPHNKKERIPDTKIPKQLVTTQSTKQDDTTTRHPQY